MASFFKVVYIPSDVERVCEEWSLNLPADKDEEISCLTLRLRQHFKQQTGLGSIDDQKKLLREQIKDHLPKGTQVTDEMLQAMMHMEGLVDSIPLILNTAKVNHIAVNMYVDDRGASKQLQINARATAVAQMCGKMLEVRGDAFLGRVFDNDDAFNRMDFTLAEMHPDAEWIQLAARLNAEKSSSTPSQSTMCSVVGQVPPSPNSIKDPSRCINLDCTQKGSLRCSRCKNAHYCSIGCQKKHWRHHKLSCKAA